ncbi:MAG: sensor domain-containing diguanylate cyclase, partial [Myxococcota bacterium]
MAAEQTPDDASSPEVRVTRASLEELRRRHAELEILYETVRDLSSTLDVEEVIERLLDRILHHLDAEIGSVLLLDQTGELRIVHSSGLPQDVVAETHISRAEGISGHVLATGEPLLVADIEADERFRRRNHERYYTRSFLSAPLIIDGEARGVLNVNNKTSRESFRVEDRRLLEAIAGHAAAALHNARRFEQMLYRSQCDALTGLLNHGRFWSGLEEEVNRSKRYSRSLSVIVIDVDHFKRYNDRHGHIEGDKALVAVAEAISGGARAHDMVARYGGEEFAVILPETGQTGAASFAEKIRDMIDSTDLGREQGGELTISAGVATYPEDGQSGADLFRRADERLYRAKAQGRNRVC